MSKSVWWASESFWRKTAIWVSAFMLVVLIFLTFDTVNQITAGSESNRVPAYSVINNRIYYKYDEEEEHYMPIIGAEAPLFGKKLTEQEAMDLVSLGKLTTQAKNCMNCHTLLGNGAYFAPDLTKAWLDQGWASESVREDLMMQFLINPEKNSRGYGSNRKMPNLGITEEEARGVIAFLKWMSSINTNGFPDKFQSIPQEGDNDY
ncbi:MAG: cytochrome c [Proteobacteria bacterium]|nr:cytochrome c [Pseudomonadota bacterium]